MRRKGYWRGQDWRRSSQGEQGMQDIPRTSASAGGGEVLD